MDNYEHVGLLVLLFHLVGICSYTIHADDEVYRPHRILAKCLIATMVPTMNGCLHIIYAIFDSVQFRSIHNGSNLG